MACGTKPSHHYFVLSEMSEIAIREKMNGTEWDGMGLNGMEWDGMGWNGMEWDGTRLNCNGIGFE